MTTEHWCELRITDQPRTMSETLVDFARPLTDQLPADYTAEELKATLTFAACVWNVVDVVSVRDAVAFMSKKMPQRLRLPAPKALSVVGKMLTRKRELFGDDHRLAM